MARKEIRYEIKTEGRDKGKIFHIQEMPATKAEKWALRCFFAIGASGVDISEMDKRLGIVGLVRHGLTALMKVPYDVAEPLLDEMMTCVQLAPSPSNPNLLRALFEGDIEEIKTFFELRKAIFGLHTDFFSDGVESTSESDPSKSTPAASLNIRTPRSKSRPQ